MTDPTKYLNDFSSYIQTQDQAVFMLILSTLLALIGWVAVNVKYNDVVLAWIASRARPVYPYALLAVYLVFTAFLWSTL